jgi:hypothetical protein
MRPIHRPLLAVLVGATLLAAGGCAHSRRVAVHRVLVPPRMDLHPYQTIGLIAFSSVARPDLAELATRQLEQAIQAAQPGTPILELGDEQEVLRTVGHAKLDFEAMKAIGSHYRVDAVLVGRLELGGVKPNVHFSPTWESLHAGASVEASLVTSLFETRAGASVWTRSAHRDAQVARLAANAAGLAGIGATDPNDAYTRLTSGLVDDVATDFWSHWEND